MLETDHPFSARVVLYSYNSFQDRLGGFEIFFVGKMPCPFGNIKEDRPVIKISHSSGLTCPMSMDGRKMPGSGVIMPISQEETKASKRSCSRNFPMR
jgi:hypothetical protein